ncbi:MAG: pyrimidine dimer DNA glycosylase/endonuclease V [Candidatus Omnitrophota bacterium]
MRLWSLHPQYLDRQGLLAVWREGLLAQKVIVGKTKGYKNHPQLERFKRHSKPLLAIGNYLFSIYLEAKKRKYQFSKNKILFYSKKKFHLKVTKKQMDYEFRHLLKKLKIRDKNVYQKISATRRVKPHPLFSVVFGKIEPWERIKD